MTSIEAVAHRIAQMDRRTLSAIERDEAKRCLVDTLGCAIAGSRSDAARVVYEASQTRGLLDQATIFGFAEGASIEEAVLANSTSARALDFNDTYSGRNNLHPSETVIPLVLAFAEARNKPGKQVIDEIAHGYDITIRLSEAIGPLLPNGWAPNATVGQIAAAGLAAWLMELDEEQIAHAIAINIINNSTLAAVFKDGLSMAKSMASGLVVHRAIHAARLASCGATGPLRAIEGAAGFVEKVAGDFDTEALSREYQEPLISNIWLKAFPTMFHFHPSIEAALQLHKQMNGSASPITSVVVRVTGPVARVAATPEHWKVKSHEDAQFSLPYSVAVALAHGKCTPGQFTDELIQDRSVRELMSKVTVEVDDSLDAGAHPQPTHVRIATADGAEHERQLRFPKGHSQNRLTDDELRDKFRLLVNPVRGDIGAEKLLKLLDAFDGPVAQAAPLFSALKGEQS